MAQAPVLQAVNQAVHLELLPAAPGIEHDRRLGDAAHLGDDVQLAEPVEALLVVGQALELGRAALRSEEHTSELQSLMRISYAVFCLKKKKTIHPSLIALSHSTLQETNTQTICH